MHMVKDQLYAYMCIYMHTIEFLQRNGKTEFISPSGPLAGSLCPSSQAPIDQKIKARQAMGPTMAHI